MPDWLQSLMDWLIPFLGGGIAGGLALAWRYGRALVHGMQAMMRGELHRIHRETVERGLPVDMDVAEEADDIYEAYHQLGGNGLGTKLHQEIIDAHNGPSSKEKKK
ncbi:hypothetical protein [Bifidobacterium sp. ESL0790]|uniref:hypothetical protein n=1 Tax=Bifidobacterium sp. ESL0790 TaxID=2983233 RepID=UPI0023F9DEA5|nr:hypothetical protein [Bifidobacterium sp. ESL0790]WEV72161.1 hypothetical protein OZY47_06890 [Bifidobacterium sp. ESL0790]